MLILAANPSTALFLVGAILSAAVGITTAWISTESAKKRAADGMKAKLDDCYKLLKSVRHEAQSELDEL